MRELERTVAIGCPIGLDMMLSMSVPINNAITMLMTGGDRSSEPRSATGTEDLLNPKMPAIPTELMIAQGTAVRAFEASSLMCTEASNPPAIHSQHPLGTDASGRQGKHTDSP